MGECLNSTENVHGVSKQLETWCFEFWLALRGFVALFAATLLHS